MVELESRMIRHLVVLLAFAAHVSADYQQKLDRYQDTMNMINTHNANPNRTFNMRFSHIAALSPEEYQRLLGTRVPENFESNSAVFESPPNYTAPDAIDWREKGAVSQVKDQGNCGSCWAFSAVGALEGQHAIKRGQMVELSEQNLIDCSRSYHNYGCIGGWPHRAFDYVRDNNGIDTEALYPYTAKWFARCQFEKADVGETDSGYERIRSGDEEALKNAVSIIGPISVAIHAMFSFRTYGDGVYNEEKCNSIEVNHGVLVVGYGTDPVGGDYWLVKNSWGADFGEKGYIRMARNRNNNCAIATFATYPIVKDSYWTRISRPKSVKTKIEKFNSEVDKVQSNRRLDFEYEQVEGTRNVDLVVNKEDHQFGFSYNRTIITSVKKGWPADLGGVKEGDEIIYMDNVYVKNISTGAVDMFIDIARFSESGKMSLTLLGASLEEQENP